MPKNKYTPEQDVQLGREAAAEVRKQYPVITDSALAGYLDRLGKRLVAAAPPELNNPVFEYSFTPVNLKEINAFALPGGPMFVNRGMFEAAKSEGEVVGVMAHELSHVLLRHGTANATKAQGLQLGQLAGAIAGAVVGGGWGQVISEGSQLRPRHGDAQVQPRLREAGGSPRRADHGARRLRPARPRADVRDDPEGGPRRRPRVDEQPPRSRQSFRIHREGSRRAARDAARRLHGRIPAGAKALRRPAAGAIDGRRGTWRRQRTHVWRLADAASVGRIGQPVPPPSTQYRTVQGGSLFDVSVPQNWEAVSSTNAVKFVPQNGYGATEGGEAAFTHGVELGVARASSRNLEDATRTLISNFARSNPDLRQASEFRDVRLSQRSGIGVTLDNRSVLGGTERIGIYTTFLADGNLFYMATIVPASDTEQYAPAFDRIARSLRLRDAR